MRKAFAHDAVVALEPHGDPRAPGAAITAALCGHWDHEPPCPIAPHHTSADHNGHELSLHVLFAADPAMEPEVRRRIETALAHSTLEGPDGLVTRWRLLHAHPARVHDDESHHAERLIQS
ncbi:hypothetical protein HNP84_004203 [Thermocatellispora tengchongensis]|uniref:Uncharacterized protein n=1 Tax=Thermocatellispora tengchongensis TaxID=1073253 RepID=A0A840P9E7_9ACTN|nr:hypothetical protein [Thermocatellispora tengchongensis]MBB5134471.1 hypothetical protein [Thermocatellispora tengchongensis]